MSALGGSGRAAPKEEVGVLTRTGHRHFPKNKAKNRNFEVSPPPARSRLVGAVRGRVLTKTGDTERRLMAIFAADVEGYSRLMGADEVGTFKDLTQRRFPYRWNSLAGASRSLHKSCPAHHQWSRQLVRCRDSQVRPVKPGLPPWGRHVRFRRVQTLVREGNPLVKLRNSA